MSFSLLGTGSPLLDIQLAVDDCFLEQAVPGKKGGMEPLTSEEISGIIQKSGKTPEYFPGGAAGNTVFALSRFQVKSALRGKLASDGNFTSRYLQFCNEHGVDTSQLVFSDTGSTGCCLALVTPDAERTMRSALGVSLELSSQEIADSAFSDYDAALFEGFMAYSGKLKEMVSQARSQKCFTILDLASFEICRKFRELFLELMPQVSMIVANSQEAEAFTGSPDPETALDILSSMVKVCAVKCGAQGVWFSGNGERFFTPAYPAEAVVDTTAAGDLWLAGYIAGKDRGFDDRTSVVCGTMFSSKVISHRGSVLTDDDVLQLSKAMSCLS